MPMIVIHLSFKMNADDIKAEKKKEKIDKKGKDKDNKEKDKKSLKPKKTITDD